MHGFSFNNKELKVKEINDDIPFFSQYADKEKQRKLQAQIMYSLKQSIHDKLIKLGFTEDECKYMIH